MPRQSWTRTTRTAGATTEVRQHPRTERRGDRSARRARGSTGEWSGGIAPPRRSQTGRLPSPRPPSCSRRGARGRQWASSQARVESRRRGSCAPRRDRGATTSISTWPSEEVFVDPSEKPAQLGAVGAPGGGRRLRAPMAQAPPSVSVPRGVPPACAVAAVRILPRRCRVRGAGRRRQSRSRPPLPRRPR
jgi:hypothetical protein